MGKAWFEDDKSSIKEFENLTIITPKITNAYFAKKIVTATGEGQNRQLSVRFDQINEGILGRDVYVIVETENFQLHPELIPSNEMANILISFKTYDNLLTGTANQYILGRNNYVERNFNAVSVTVGDLSELEDINGNCPYMNADDFTDTAIIKIAICPDNRETFNVWSENIDASTNTPPQIIINVKPEDEEVIVSYNENFSFMTDNKQTPDGFDFTNNRYTLVNKNFYTIYHTNNLFNKLPTIRNVRKKIGELINNRDRVVDFDENNPKYNVTYFYFDNIDNEHEVCTTVKHRIIEKRRARSVPPLDQRGELIESIDFTENRRASENINASSLQIYENGTYSDNNGSLPKWYASQNNELYLVDADIVNEEGVGPQTFEALNYNDTTSGLTIAFGFRNTRRRYAQPQLFAAIIGALAELNLNESTSDLYIVSEGFAYVDGSCYPSSMHVNGEAFDTYYLTNHDNQQTFINFLRDYGFGRNIVGCNMHYNNSIRDCHPRQSGTIDAGQIHEGHMHSDTFLTNRIHSII